MNITAAYKEAFKHDMECFLKEYREKLYTNVRNGKSEDTWKDIRDMLLCDFPKLKDCYAMHGKEQTLPLSNQSEKAKLGRWLAGAMYSIRKSVYNNRHTLMDKKINHTQTKCAAPSIYPRNWVKQTPIRKTTNVPAIADHPLAREILSLKPEEEISFYYNDYDKVLDDADAARMIVDYSGHNLKNEPYSIRIEPTPKYDPKQWILTVCRIKI